MDDAPPVEDAPVHESANAKRFKPLKSKLLLELSANALDYENPPTEAIKEAPHPMFWVPETDPEHEKNPKGQNSVWLLGAIKGWELDMPSMSLVIHGSSQHPMHLIQDKGLREQRTDFLKSRPRFNDNYFDGQRDPVEGWMAAVNAWRYPAFYVGPHYAMAEFKFSPPHTLFIDAELQAQDDAELIGKMDRVNNEWIMDAVTHQPLGKQAAVKDNDGIFYWDLNVKQAVTPSGVLPPQTQYVGNMRQSYEEWYKGMEAQWDTVKENNPQMIDMLLARTKFLVKTTRPRNVRNWNRFTHLVLLQDLRRVELEKERELERGEVRIEIMFTRLNKAGLQKLSTISPDAAAGDGFVLIKSMIPGDDPPEQLSEPYPLKKGHAKFKGRNSDRIERRYRTEGNHEEHAELNDILEDPDPSRSEVVIDISLASKNGRQIYAKDDKGKEYVKGLIGTTRVSLKELIRDGKPNSNGTCEHEMQFELMGIESEAPKLAVPGVPGAPGTGGKKGAGGRASPSILLPPKTAPKSPKPPSPLRRGSTLGSFRASFSSSKVEPVEEEPEVAPAAAEDDDDEKKIVMVPVGVVMARIAIRPPEGGPTNKPQKPTDGDKTPQSNSRPESKRQSGMATPQLASPRVQPSPPTAPPGSNYMVPAGGVPASWADPAAGVGPYMGFTSMPLPTAGAAWPNGDSGSLPARMLAPPAYPPGGATFEFPPNPFPPTAGGGNGDLVGGPLDLSGMRAPPGALQLDVEPSSEPLQVVAGWPAMSNDAFTPPPSPPPPNAPQPGIRAALASAPPPGAAPAARLPSRPASPKERRASPPTLAETRSPPLVPSISNDLPAETRSAPLAPSTAASASELPSLRIGTPGAPVMPVGSRPRSPRSSGRASGRASVAAPAATTPLLEAAANPFDAKKEGSYPRRASDEAEADDDARSVKSEPKGETKGESKGESKAGDKDPISSDDEEGKAEAKGGGDANIAPGGQAVALLAQTLAYTATKDTLVYTFAYWIKWKPIETLSDQLLFFGETRNMPAMVRNNKLGALVDNRFCPTDFDPRLAGDNWCLLVVTNDGQYSQFWIGYNSNDTKGAPQPARAKEPDATRPATMVPTEMDADVQIRRLVTSSKGAGFLAQAWIWPRDLQPEEIKELWIETKGRYPLWKPGIATYRPPPLSSLRKAPSNLRALTPKTPKTPKDGFVAGMTDRGSPPSPSKRDSKQANDLPWDKFDPIIEKDNAAMLDCSLASKLAFQRLKNVFSVLVDYAAYSQAFIVIDKNQNSSPMAELMLEVALRANTGQAPVVLVMDSRPRLEKANAMLKALIDCKFFIDQEKTYKNREAAEEQKLTEYKLTSIDYAGPRADLRRLVTPAGLAWLRASSTDLTRTVALIDAHPNHPKMCEQVVDIFRHFQCDDDLERDRRPVISRLWKIFYDAQLFASGTHYIIFDVMDFKAKPVIASLGTIGTIFMHGSNAEHRKIVECVQDGSPMLLLESTGGVTQAFSYVIKAVRLMKPKWHIDFVMRLITEYKQRAAKYEHKEKLKKENRKLVLDNIILLDKELARIDLLLSAGEHSENWMRSFGLPEALMLFEIWQRSPDFVMRQFQTADVMKRSAESLLDLFTGCFSSAGSPPELGLGNAETKVVATAWNRHLVLFNNAAMYNKRSWTMQFVMYFLGLTTTTLSIITQIPALSGVYLLDAAMLLLPIIIALLGTIGTRLRQRQKYSVCKMASFEIVSEIYKFRLRSLEYDPQALALALRAAQEGPADKKKKGDDEPVAPISAKEKDRLARKMFVTRIQMIYMSCMASEMSKGTSVSHKTGGLDAARLLVDEDADNARSTMFALQKHVADGLYFISLREWALTAEVVKQEAAHTAETNARERQRALRQFSSGIVRGFFTFLIWLASGVILGGYSLFEQCCVHRCRRSGKNAGVDADDLEGGREVSKAAGRKKEKADEDGPNAAQLLVQSMRAWLSTLSSSVGMDVVSEAADGADAEDVDNDAARAERLDTRYLEDDETGPAGAASADDGGGLRVKDDLMTAMSIDDYMTFRGRPVCSYLEKTAPWRAFELQCLEVSIFVINSSGAVLVGLSTSLIPYVALTVSLGAVCTSFLEFSRLQKQVEAYNQSHRELYNLFNAWDGMTSTERRTRPIITQVVSTVENAVLFVAIALTDAIPSTQGGGGDGEEDEEKEE